MIILNITIKKKEFKSIGEIQLKDKLNNIYKFTQIYIDEKSKELFGTDSKAFLNNSSFKFNKDNKPRIFSNAIKLKKMNPIL